MSPRHRDAIRTTALAATAVAVTTVPTLGPIIRGEGEKTDRYDTCITPPGYAFTVWAPIFAGTLANAAQAALPGRQDVPDNRASGWPLALAYALNTVWSIAAQSDRFAYTPVLLPAAVAATATAYRRLNDLPGTETITSASTGLLLGWTSLAATVNLSAASQLIGARAQSAASIRASAAGSAAASAVLAVAVTRSQRGYLPLASAAVWGLATTALDRRRPTLVRITSAAGVVAISSAATLTAIRRRRRESPEQP